MTSISAKQRFLSFPFSFSSLIFSFFFFFSSKINNRSMSFSFISNIFQAPTPSRSKHLKDCFWSVKYDFSFLPPPHNNNTHQQDAAHFSQSDQYPLLFFDEILSVCVPKLPINHFSFLPFFNLLQLKQKLLERAKGGKERGRGGEGGGEGGGSWGRSWGGVWGGVGAGAPSKSPASWDENEMGMGMGRGKRSGRDGQSDREKIALITCQLLIICERLPFEFFKKEEVFGVDSVKEAFSLLRLYPQILQRSTFSEVFLVSFSFFHFLSLPLTHLLFLFRAWKELMVYFASSSLLSTSLAKLPNMPSPPLSKPSKIVQCLINLKWSC